jgi:hypothetical protein
VLSPAGATLAAVRGGGVDGLGARRPSTPGTDSDDAASLAVAEDHERTIPSIVRWQNCVYETLTNGVTDRAGRPCG